MSSLVAQKHRVSDKPDPQNNKIYSNFPTQSKPTKESVPTILTESEVLTFLHCFYLIRITYIPIEIRIKTKWQDRVILQTKQSTFSKPLKEKNQ